MEKRRVDSLIFNLLMLVGIALSTLLCDRLLALTRTPTATDNFVIRTIIMWVFVVLMGVVYHQCRSHSNKKQKDTEGKGN